MKKTVFQKFFCLMLGIALVFTLASCGSGSDASSSSAESSKIAESSSEPVSSEPEASSEAESDVTDDLSEEVEYDFSNYAGQWFPDASDEYSYLDITGAGKYTIYEGDGTVYDEGWLVYDAETEKVFSVSSNDAEQALYAVGFANGNLIFDAYGTFLPGGGEGEN